MEPQHNLDEEYLNEGPPSVNPQLSYLVLGSFVLKVSYIFIYLFTPIVSEFPLNFIFTFLLSAGYLCSIWLLKNLIEKVWRSSVANLPIYLLTTFVVLGLGLSWLMQSKIESGIMWTKILQGLVAFDTLISIWLVIVLFNLPRHPVKKFLNSYAFFVSLNIFSKAITPIFFTMLVSQGTFGLGQIELSKVIFTVSMAFFLPIDITLVVMILNRPELGIVKEKAEVES